MMCVTFLTLVESASPVINFKVGVTAQLQSQERLSAIQQIAHKKFKVRAVVDSSLSGTGNLRICKSLIDVDFDGFSMYFSEMLF